MEMERFGDSFTEDYCGYRNGFLVKRTQFLTVLSSPYALSCSVLYLKFQQVLASNCGYFSAKINSIISSGHKVKEILGIIREGIENNVITRQLLKSKREYFLTENRIKL